MALVSDTKEQPLSPKMPLAADDQRTEPEKIAGSGLPARLGCSADSVFSYSC
jgi:hypothetical protein